jgi:ribosome-associated translation inhibitor RaiA
MIRTGQTGEGFEISTRFRQTVEARITRLERDADHDERGLCHLAHPDHIRRHSRLIAAQRSEAQRMRLFLDRCRPQLPSPIVAF